MKPTTNSGVVLDPALDGITHTNIYSKAKTPLGRHMSFFQFFLMTIMGHGVFHSLEGYWYWIASGMQYDSLRYLSGMDAKRQGRLFVANGRVHVPNFDALIESAVNQRVEQDPGLKQAIKESTLPFAHYYVDDYGNVIVAKTQICVEIYERIRTRLQNM